MRSRLSSALTGISLFLLLAVDSHALTLPELAHREKLEAQPQLAATYGRVEPAKGKYDFVLTAWKKDNHWGVISEQRHKHDASSRWQAAWLAKPTYAAVLVPNFTRTQGHVWLKPEGDARWQVFQTDGRKLKPLGTTPYSDVRVLREGQDSRSQSSRSDPTQDIRPRYRELIMGVHAGHDPASATVDLIDVGENRVLVTIQQLDLREEPLLENRMLLLRHDATANGHTLVRLPAPPAPTEAHGAVEVSAFYWNLRLDGPVASALDSEGSAVILDKELRPVVFEGRTLGQPMPLHPAWRESDRFYKVQVGTHTGQAGYQFIYRDKNGKPALDPAIWHDILQIQGYVIVVKDSQWHLMTAIRRDGSYDFQPRQLNGQPVTAATPDALYAAVAEVKRIDMKQAAIAASERAAQQARWQAEYAEQRRQEAAEKADLQRRIDENAKARIAAEAEYARLKAQSADEFAARNQSSWGNLQPITLPSASGAPGLSTLEKDHYDNRGNARNPYVVRDKPKP